MIIQEISLADEQWAQAPEEIKTLLHDWLTELTPTTWPNAATSDGAIEAVTLRKIDDQVSIGHLLANTTRDNGEPEVMWFTPPQHPAPPELIAHCFEG